MIIRNIIFSLSILFLLSCATQPPRKVVRQVDLDAWRNVPVGALDTHSFFITIPLVKTITPDGIEIRNYVNKKNISNCYGNANVNVNSYLSYANYNEFTRCSSGAWGCDNIFYIKDGLVLDYTPVGNCHTDEYLQPEERYFKLLQD